ncbi:MAG: hypothetical protein K2G13_03020 [Muribaculaceae bacterium]|nr:hypothetical protein [Muribaculaceae bacterium]
MCAINRCIQPDFWLEIRKEYIIENFEKLLYYVRRYQFDKNNEAGKGEFLTTCRYLIDLAKELSEYSCKRSFIVSPEFKISGSDKIIDDALAFRIMVAAIIAAQKIGKDEHVIIARLINLLVLSHKLPHIDIANELIYVITNCIRKSSIKTLGMNWSDIENKNTFSPIRLLHNISRTKFDVDSGEDGMFEGKGTVVFSEDMVLAAPVNKTDFLKSNNLTEYISIGRNLKLLLQKSDHVRHPENVEDVAEGMIFMSRAQGSVKTSVVETKRNYTAGTIIPVVIKSSWGVKVEAETFQPQYLKVSGKVNINLLETLRYADIFCILSYFTVGTVLFVEYTPDNPEFRFQLRAGFNQFYNEYAILMRGETLPGIYIGDYSAGTQWLTEDGF